MGYGRVIWKSGCCGVTELREELEFYRFEGSSFGIEDIKEIAKALLDWVEEKERTQ